MIQNRMPRTRISNLLIQHLLVDFDPPRHLAKILTMSLIKLSRLILFLCDFLRSNLRVLCNLDMKYILTIDLFSIQFLEICSSFR